MADSLPGLRCGTGSIGGKAMNYTEQNANDLVSAMRDLINAQKRIGAILSRLKEPPRPLEPFIVRLRAEQTARSLWSLFVSAGSLKEDIVDVWPESNMEFFSMQTTGEPFSRSWRLRDLNRRELNELLEWCEAKVGETAEEPKLEKGITP